MTLSLAPLPALPSIEASMQAATAPQDSGLGVFDQLWIKLAKLANPSQATAIDNAAASSASSPAASSQAQQAAQQAANQAQAQADQAKAQGGGVMGGLEALGAFFTWAADVVNRDQAPAGGGVSLEDLILIVLGLVLLAAAVVGLVFTSAPAKAVRKEIGSLAGTAKSTARGAAHSAVSAGTKAAIAAAIP